MDKIDPARCRIETLISGLLYMMTAYRRRSCPRLALSIAAHLDCLAHHPDAADTVRQVASGMCGEWKRATLTTTPAVPSVSPAPSKKVLH